VMPGRPSAVQTAATTTRFDGLQCDLRWERHRSTGTMLVLAQASALSAGQPAPLMPGCIGVTCAVDAFVAAG
jgi:hypothetical protein